MRSYSVAARGLQPVEVLAGNWITALGLGLDKLARADAIERLACEVLPNGTVIARDISTGMGYVVQLMVDEAIATIEEASLDDVIEVGGDTAVDVMASIDEATEEEMACEAALGLCRDTMQAQSGSIIIDQGGYLQFIVVFGPGADKLAGVKLPLGTGVAGYSMLKKRSVVLGNAAEDPRHFGEVDKLTGNVTREIACVPIFETEHVYGVIEMLNLPEGKRFTREDVHHMQAIANRLGARLARLA
jgi:GAF domain-containing protein